MPEIPTNILDHIVHLVPTGSLNQASEEFRALGFTVLPGGAHSSGLSTNALVILADAIYLEIISFTHSTHPPEKHPWAKRAPGWIAYAFLGNGSLVPEKQISTVINHRAEKEGSTVKYLAEVKGGRTRQDGVHLAWLISAPQDQEWGILPFFCGDITPRGLRVPTDHAKHASGAVGIAYVKILADVSLLQASAKRLTAVIGSISKQLSETRFTWDLQSPNSRVTRLILTTPSDDDETLFVEEVGAGAIYEIGIATTSREGTVKTPYGRLTWVSSDMPMPIVSV